jgi:hypothetical protein
MWTGEPRANDEGGVQLSLESVQVNAIAVSHERRYLHVAIKSHALNHLSWRSMLNILHVEDLE